MAVAEDVVAVVPTELSAAAVPEARALLVVEHPVSASAASKVTEVAEVSIFYSWGKNHFLSTLFEQFVSIFRVYIRILRGNGYQPHQIHGFLQAPDACVV